jgi:hypothetical protein
MSQSGPNTGNSSGSSSNVIVTTFTANGTWTKNVNTKFVRIIGWGGGSGGGIGMTQINTLSGVIQSVTSTTSFTVNINTTGFTAYSSGGIANVITGRPALQGGSLASGNALGFSPLQLPTTQVLNTALFNAGGVGLTLGTSLMVTTSDVWEFMASLDTPVTS